MAFLFRAVGIGALTALGFAASGCGPSRALPGVDGAGGAAGVGDAAGDATAKAGGSGAGDHGGDASPGSAGTAGDAGGDAGGWAAIVRLFNAGTTDVLLPENLATTCVFSIRIAPVAGGDARLLSATPPDSWCDCSRCGTTGRRLCDAVDPICDGPPAKLPPGGQLDMAWDGEVAVTTSAPPAGSSCPFVCDHWELVIPGDYVFTVETLSGAFMARAAVPDSAGVISLPING